MRLKISAGVDGWPSGGSSVCRPGSEDPHRREQIFNTLISVTLDALTSALYLGMVVRKINKSFINIVMG